MYSKILKYLVSLIFIHTCLLGCISEKKALQNLRQLNTYNGSLYVNDSIGKFYELEEKIINQAFSESTIDNPISQYFKKNISKRALSLIKFKNEKDNIFIEFTLDQNKKVNYIKTNSINKLVDLEIKQAFEKIKPLLLKNITLSPIYKYNLVIIQNTKENIAVIKCNKKAISYIPPIYGDCVNATNYNQLRRCNYVFITDFLYNNVDLTLIKDEDIDQENMIIPTIIIDNKGNVIAAKVESNNKVFLEAYYNTIKNIPQAKEPAKFNYINKFYGYKFPAKINEIIINNNGFKSFSKQPKNLRINSKKVMKNYIAYLKHNTL